ncbi:MULTISPECIES: response regulator [unclassified Pseudodesulfovibrio]|uniref:response regulator n=1 Tax=unclassified Pseudodesulfovibrio TaxID=2661612 RepID=UPI000FEBEE2B|nr:MULTISPECIES: response regulator [unclassified Pseudodesulfovibrio]MCJ2163277.1 response regulator [Pseudodesulfovibrio sp. S3-i]RWU07257.1 response regulator [Pseudodesulfovibrio sp. S3]
MSDIRVLLIDDEVDYITTLAKRLDRRGLSISLAGGGGQALELMARETFDVVLLDIKMAGMDGIKTLSEIKQRHPQVEVIMLTGHANTNLVISSLAMGAYDYLMKPVDVDALILKIEDAAARKKSNLE